MGDLLSIPWIKGGSGGGGGDLLSIPLIEGGGGGGGRLLNY